MKKRKLNALIAAGCLTFLAPLSAHAEDLGNVTINGSTPTSDRIKTLESGANTFTSITVSDDAKYTIKTNNGTLNPNNGGAQNVILNDSAILEFSPAVKNVVLGTNSTTTDPNNIQVNGNNTINFTSIGTETNPTLDLGSVGFGTDSAKSLTLNSTTNTPAGGATPLKGNIKANLVKLNGTSTNAQTLNLTGDGNITITNVDVTAASKGNSIVAKASDGNTGTKNISGKVTLNAGTDADHKTELTLSSQDAGTTLAVQNVELQNLTNLTTAGDKTLTLANVAIKGADAGITVNNGSTTIGTVTMDANTNLHTAGTSAATIATIDAKNAGSNVLNANANKTQVTKINVGDGTVVTNFTFSADNTATTTADEIKNVTVNKGSSLSLKANGNDIVQSSLSSSDKGVELVGGEVTHPATPGNASTLNITNEIKHVTLNKITATGDAVVNNENVQDNSTLGHIVVNAYSTDGGTSFKDSRLSLNSNVADGKVTRFNGATLTGAGFEGTTPKYAVLALDSTNGAIYDTADINLNGAGDISVSGTKDITLGKIIAKNNDNILNNEKANQSFNIEVDANAADVTTTSLLKVNAQAKTNISSTDDAISITGQPTKNAILELSTESADINVQKDLKLNGNGQLYFNGANKVTTNDSKIYVSATGNTVKAMGTGDYDIQNIVLQNPSSGTQEAELTVINTVKNTGNVQFNATTNTLNTQNETDSAVTEFNNLVLGDTATSAALKVKKANASFNTTSGVSAGKQLTLGFDLAGDDTSNHTITGAQVVLDGGTLEVAGVSGNTKSKITLATPSKSGVLVNNTGGAVKVTNSVGTGENATIKLNNIEVNANGTGSNVKLTLDGVKTDNYTGIAQTAASNTQGIDINLKSASQLKAFSANSGQALSVTGADISDNEIINDTADRNVGTLNAGTSSAAGNLKLTANANTKYTSANVYAGSKLELNAQGGNIAIDPATGTTSLIGGNDAANTAKLKVTKVGGNTVSLGKLHLEGNTTLDNVNAGYTSFEFANGVDTTVNMIDSTLIGSDTTQISDPKTITIQTATGSTGASSVGNFQLRGSSLGNDAILTLEADNGNLTAGAVELNGFSKLNLNDSTNTLSVGAIKATGDYNVINNSGVSLSSGVTIGDGESTKGSLEIKTNNTKNMTYSTASLKNGSSLTLNADSGKITGTSTSLGSTSADTLTITEKTDGDVTLGALTLSNKVNLNNVDTANYTTLDLSSLVQAQLKDSNLAISSTPVAIASTKSQTYTTAATNNTSTIGNYTITGASGDGNAASLTLQSTDGTLNVGTIGLNGYANLNTSGDSTIGLTNLTVSKTNNSITNANSTVVFGTLGVGTASDNATLTLKADADTDFAGANITGKSISETSDLTLNANNGVINSTQNVNLNGNAKLIAEGSKGITFESGYGIIAKNSGNIIDNNAVGLSLAKLNVGTTGATATKGELILNVAGDTNLNGANVTGTGTGTGVSVLTLNTDKDSTHTGKITLTDNIALNGNAQLNTNGSKAIDFGANNITAVNNNNVIDNTNALSNGITLGNLNVGTTGATATKGELTVYSEKATKINGATVTGNTVGGSANVSKLTLNTDKDTDHKNTIAFQNNLALNGNAELVTSGTQAITFETTKGLTTSGANNTVTNNNTASNFGAMQIAGNTTLDNVQYNTVATGTKNYSSLTLGTGETTISLKNGSDLINGTNDLVINADQTLTVDNVDAGAAVSNVGNINMTAGASGTTTLTLKPSSGDLSISDIDMNGKNTVNIGSNDKTYTKTVTSNGTITATGETNVINNYIANTDLNDVNVGVATADLATDGKLTINANKATTIGNINLGETAGTGAATKRADGTLTVNASANTTLNGTTNTVTNNSTLNINNTDTDTAVTTTFGTIGLQGTSKSEKATLNLNAGTKSGSEITGTQLNLNGYTQVDLSGAGSITMGVNVTGLDNHIEKDTASSPSVNLGTITTSNGSELYTAHLIAGTDFTAITGGGTHYDDGSDLGDIIIAATDSDKVINETGVATFDNVGVRPNKTLTLNTTSSASSLTQNPGKKFELDTGAKVKFNENAISSTGDDPKGQGEIKFNATRLYVDNNVSVYNDKGGAKQIELPVVEFKNAGDNFNSYGNLKYDVKQNGANTINVNGMSTDSGAVAGNTDIGTITTSGTSVLTVKSDNDGTAKIANITKASGDGNYINVKLDANGGNIEYTNASKLNLTNGDSLEISDALVNTVKLTNGISVQNSGDGKTTLTASTINDGSTFGTIDLSEAVLEVTGLTSKNHTLGTISKDNTINASASTINGATIASSATDQALLTIVTNDTTSGKGIKLSGATSVTGQTGKIAQYTLDADKNTITNDGGTITLNSNAKLQTTGDKGITGLAVTVKGLNNTIENDNDNAAYSSIALDDGAVLNAIGVNASEISLTGTTATINSNGSSIGDVTVDSDKTFTLEASTGTAEFDNIVLNAGSGTTAADTTKLNLKPTAAKITGDSITLKGNSLTTISSGTGSVELLDKIYVAGNNNVIENSANFTTGDIDFGTTGGNITIKANGGSTTLDGLTGTGVKTVTFNADNGTIASNNKLTLNDSDSLTLKGSKGITLTGANIGGETNGATLTIDKISDKIMLGDVSISGKGALVTANDVIDTVEVNTIKSSDSGVWNLDFDQTTKTTDTLNITGNQTDKLTFNISKALNFDGAKYYVEYVNLLPETDAYVLNTTAGLRNVVKVSGDTGTRYSYVDNSEGPVVDNDYAPNTIRITNYNIASDNQLDYLTRQGTRTFEMSNGNHYSRGNDVGMVSLPNMQAREKVENDNIYTITAISAIEGRQSDKSKVVAGETIHEENNRMQMFIIDSTDNIDRTFNLEGASINSSLSDDVFQDGNTGVGSAIHTLSTSTSGAVNVNLRPNYNSDTFREGLYEYKVTQEKLDEQGVSTAREYFDKMTDKDKTNPDSYIYGDEVVNLDGSHSLFMNKDVVFNDNYSTIAGGAVYNDGEKSTITTASVTDKGVQYINNVAGLGIDENQDPNNITAIDKYYADADGGAVYNTNGAKYIANGKTTFENNVATGDGGALYNNNASFILNDKIVFSNNTAQNLSTSTGTKLNNGGAVYNTNNATFIANADSSFTSNTSLGDGGALYNNNASFTTNGATSYSDNISGMLDGSDVSVGFGGAVANTNGAAYIANSDTNFSNNTAIGHGGAVYNDNANISLGNTDGSSTTTFNGNTAAVDAGALYNTNNAYITLNGTSNFVSNVATGKGGAVLNDNGATFATNGNSTFNRNLSLEGGGAIYNDNATVRLGNTDGSSTTTFYNNETLANGGAHASVNNDFTTYGNVNYKFNTSVSGNGGAFSVTDGSNVTMNTGTQTFTNNKAGGLGGAIYMKGIAAVDAVTDPDTGAIITPAVEAKSSVIHITANGKSVFEGNRQNAAFTTEIPDGATDLANDADCGHVIYTSDGNHTDSAGNTVKHYAGEHYTTDDESNAIYFDGDSTLELETQGSNGAFYINDKIASNPTSVNNKLVQNGTVYYNNDMSGYNGTFNLNSGIAHFNMSGGPTTFGSETNRADYILNGGSTLDVQNGSVNPIYANSLDLSNTSALNPAIMQLDLNLTTETADYFSVTQSTSGNILVSDIDVYGDTTTEYMYVPVVEAEGDATANVNVDTSVTSITSPNSLYEYDVTGVTNGLILQHTANDTGVLAPQVAVNARLAGQLDLLNDVLHRVDQIAENRYFHKIERNNLYAADPNVLDDRRIDNGYTPYVNQEDGGCTWVKGNATIENISPSGQDGYKNRAYNAFIGYETPVATLKNGWDLINTVFGGYQGSFQDYDNIENWQNGGSGGYMANLYHNNFFAGGVVMMGGTNVDVKDSGKYSRDMNFGLFDIAASTRVGYNVGMGNHWLFQPMLTTSYIYVTGLDRHNAHGDDVYLDGTSTIQVAPGFKIVGNYAGWKPYVLFDYTWPIVAKTAATVNDADLPDLGLRSYIEYGLGLRKDMGERFTGHVEAVMRNGGRTGVSFQGGLVFKF